MSFNTMSEWKESKVREIKECHFPHSDAKKRGKVYRGKRIVGKFTL